MAEFLQIEPSENNYQRNLRSLDSLAKKKKIEWLDMKFTSMTAWTDDIIGENTNNGKRRPAKPTILQNKNMLANDCDN